MNVCTHGVLVSARQYSACRLAVWIHSRAQTNTMRSAFSPPRLSFWNLLEDSLLNVDERFQSQPPQPDSATIWTTIWTDEAIRTVYDLFPSLRLVSVCDDRFSRDSARYV
jgi:hypothetical protein